VLQTGIEMFPKTQSRKLIEENLEERPMNLRQFHQRIVKREEELGMKKEESVILNRKGLKMRQSGPKKRLDQSLFPHVM